MCKLDIVIVNYNSADHLEACLQSISQFIGEYIGKVVVIDNASDIPPLRRQYRFVNVLIHYNKKNLGFSAAVNQGVRLSSSPYVMLLNPDAYLKDDCVGPMLRYLDKNLDVAVVGPKVLNSDGSLQGSARSFPNLFTGLFGRTSILSRLFPDNRLTRRNIVVSNNDILAPLPVDWVSGACMLLRRDVLNEVGEMDERFFMYWEDADLCRRMTSAGWRVIYFPQVEVVHKVGKSSERRPINSLLAFTKSAYLLFCKYLDPRFGFVKPFVFFALAVRFYTVVLVKLAPKSLFKKRYE